MADKQVKTIRKTVAPKRTVDRRRAGEATPTTVAPTNTVAFDAPADTHLHGEPIMPPRHDRIAARAYARFVARGHVHGHDVDDWLAAESEMQDLCRLALK